MADWKSSRLPGREIKFRHPIESIKICHIEQLCVYA